jgi:hypothetical protein
LSFCLCCFSMQGLRRWSRSSSSKVDQEMLEEFS